MSTTSPTPDPATFAHEQEPVRLLLIDIETTGLSRSDELIGLALMVIEVDRRQGQFLRISDVYEGFREPLSDLHPQAAQVLGYDKSALVGKRLDTERIVSLKLAMIQKMFPKPGCKVPEARFGAFSGPWSSEEMETLGTFSKGAGFSKSDLKASGTPIVLYGRLYTDYQTAITQVDTFVEDRNGTVKSKGNEVVVPASGETSEDIARASALLASGIIIGGDLNIISPCDRLDPYFLALALSNGQPKCDLARRAQGKTVVHVRGTDISSVSISFPELREQGRIAAYFRSIDELIFRHSNQIKKLQQVKLACQESMFA